MIRRNIISIDEELCDGCGLCISACEEGAIKIIDGKAKLIDEAYCDGLGACLGSCPKGAIKIVEKESKPFNEEAVKKHLIGVKIIETPRCDCFDYAKNHKLNNWPIQLRLVSVDAKFLKNADLVIAADCTAFSFRGFHELLRDRRLLIACPKLDDIKYYLEKLTEIFKLNNIKSIDIIRMSVPCCGGLTGLIRNAILNSEVDIPLNEKIIEIDGTLKI